MKQASVVDVAHKLRLDRDVILGIDDSRTANCAEKKKKKNQILTLRKTEARRTTETRLEARGERNTMFTFACYKCYADELSSS